jgi:polysaccharide export outer membrane protein
MARMGRAPALILIAVWILFPAAVVVKGQGKSSAISGPTGSRVGIIGPNDALTIYVRGVDDLSKPWRVDPNGLLTLPLVGTLQAAGKTVDRFELDLAAKLKEFVINPEVTVSIADLQSQPVTVTGAVVAPGVQQLEERKSLLSVLMQAGGPKDAGPTLTITRRADVGAIPISGAREEKDGQYSVATLNLKDVMDASTPAANLIVRPQDVISVSLQPPQAAPRLVQIIGEVTKPGAVELVHQQSVSLMQALAAAGGPTHIASTGKTVIMHVNVDGRRTEVAQIDLKKVMEGKVKDIELVGGDIVVVPTSQFKNYLEIGAKAAVTSGGYVLTRF